VTNAVGYSGGERLTTQTTSGHLQTRTSAAAKNPTGTKIRMFSVRASRLHASELRPVSAREQEWTLNPTVRPLPPPQEG
jgi:hypothetical protein